MVCRVPNCFFSGGGGGGLTHCDPLSMPSGALLQWLVCAITSGAVGGDSPKPLFLLSPFQASSEQTSCLIHFLGEGHPLELRGLPPQRHLARGFICF